MKKTSADPSQNGTALNELFVQTAGSFCESLQCWQMPAQKPQNLFGRQVEVQDTSSLGSLLGLSASGIRTAALIRDDQLQDKLDLLKAFSRQHLPFTLVLSGNGLAYLPALAQTGSIVFQANSAQSLADYILMAQVISEKALTPVVVLTSGSFEDWDWKKPSPKKLVNWFGDPDIKVAPPTPAQQMVFGKGRRRMPSWQQADLPVMSGVLKNDRDKAFEIASREVFERPHIQQLIDETTAAFAGMAGRSYNAADFYGENNFRNLIITTASSHTELEALSNSRLAEKKRLGILSLKQVFPLHLPEMSRKLERLLVLEPVYFTSQQGWMYKELAARKDFEKAEKQNGWYAAQPDGNAWTAALENLVESRDPRHQYWLDVSFSLSQSAYPKHQVLVEEIRRNYPEVEQLSLTSMGATTGSATTKTFPVSVRKYTNQGPPFSRLNRFYDDTTAIYESNEFLADPFQAFPVMPMASAAFSPAGALTEIPEFDTANCEDFADVLTACPHAAMPVALLTIEELLKSGIQQARSKGEAIGQIVPLLKIWAKNAIPLAKARLGKATKAEDFLAEAFDKTLSAAKADEEKKATLQDEYAAIMHFIGPLPTGVTEKVFMTQEARKAGTGELIIMGVDPSACAGCEFCAAASESVKMRKLQDRDLEQMQQDFERFEALPLTSDDTIERLIEDPEFDSVAAIVCNRDYYRAISGPTGGEEDAAAKTILRMFSAVATHKLKPKQAQTDKLISKQVAVINNSIKKMLGDALPVNHLNSLMEVLSGHSEERLSMDRIFGEWGQEQAFKIVDRDQLQRKLELIESLKQLKWALKEGLTGRGRAPYSIVLDKSLGFAATYPWNLFKVPVLVAEHDAAAVALGSFRGQLRHAMDNIRLLRRAELEAANKYKPSEHDAAIAGLSWKDLTDEERAMVPPVFVLATADWLSESRQDQVQELLSTGFPIKIILIDSGVVNVSNAVAEINSRNSAFWPLVAEGSSLVGRGSLADTEHLFKLWRRALRYHGSAVVSVLAPTPTDFDIHSSQWAQLSGLAVSSRAFLPMHYDPEAPGISFGSRLKTDFNHINEDWNQTEITFRESGEEKKQNYSLSWADWAFMQHRLKAGFTKLQGEENTVPVAKFLELDEAARAAKTPVILRVDKDGHLQRYAVAPPLIEACEAVRHHFRLLREWAGLYTEFPEKLKKQVDGELRKEYEAEKEKLVAEMAAEKQTWETEHLAQIKAQMKERLLKMSGH